MTFWTKNSGEKLKNSFWTCFKAPKAIYFQKGFFTYYFIQMKKFLAEKAGHLATPI
jgi:hypothetical protein